MNYTKEGWEEEQMSNLGCESVSDLIAEVKRLREENETLRKMDWEYECLWTWLAENTNLLNTIEPLMEEWKKEYDEEWTTTKTVNRLPTSVHGMRFITC